MKRLRVSCELSHPNVIIEQILRWMIPGYWVLQDLDPDADGEFWESVRDKAKSLRSELEQKNQAELRRIFRREERKEAKTQARLAEYEKEWAEFDDKQRFFNQPDAKADFEYWSKAAYWDLEEGVSLLMGTAPEKTVSINVLLYINESPFAKRYERILDLAMRAKDMGLLKNPCAPVDFLNWASRSKIEVPSDLDRLVREHVRALTDCNNVSESMTLQNATASQLSEPVSESENKSLPAEKTRAVRTSKATKARIDQKATRKAAQKAFIERIKEKLAAGNYNWDLDDIPVTKADFCKVARRLYPGIKNYKDRTITNDLGELGVKFRPGTNNRENNILEQFFPAPKLT